MHAFLEEGFGESQVLPRMAGPDSKQGLHADRPLSSDSAPRTWQPPGFSLFPGKSEEARRKDVEMLT